MKLKEINIAGFALGILILLQGCSSNPEVISKWAEQSITIDGKYDDWDNKTIYIEDGNFLMGIQNDDEYLYLAFISADRNIQAQIMRSGLIVWFDREGGTDKKFGVKFPIGFMEDEIIPMRQSIEENPDLFDQIFKKGQNELEILIPSNDETKRMHRSQAGGIDAKISHTDDRLVYEMKIAFQPDNNNLYGIGIFPETNNKHIIGIGFETGEIDREGMKRKMMSGTMDGMNKEQLKEMEGRRGGGMKGGMRNSIPEPIKYWIRLQLAQNK